MKLMCMKRAADLLPLPPLLLLPLLHLLLLLLECLSGGKITQQ